MRSLSFWLWLLLAAGVALPGCQSPSDSSAKADAPDSDSTLSEADLDPDAPTGADLQPVPLSQYPREVVDLLGTLQAAPGTGTNGWLPYVDPQHPVQYLHESNGPTANLDVLTADELLGIRPMMTLVQRYQPTTWDHYLAPPTWNGCDPRPQGMYLVNLQEPFTVLSSLYTNRMEDSGGEVNSKKLEALRQVDEETRQILQAWYTDENGTLGTLRLFLRRHEGKLYLAAIDATDCN